MTEWVQVEYLRLLWQSEQDVGGLTLMNVVKYSIENCIFYEWKNCLVE